MAKSNVSRKKQQRIREQARAEKRQYLKAEKPEKRTKKTKFKSRAEKERYRRRQAEEQKRYVGQSKIKIDVKLPKINEIRYNYLFNLAHDLESTTAGAGIYLSMIGDIVDKYGKNYAVERLHDSDSLYEVCQNLIFDSKQGEAVYHEAIARALFSL